MVMKINGFFMMALFLMASPLYAQDQPPSADEIVSRMQAKLNLTQAQITAITPIIEKYSTKREDLRQSMEDGTADRDSIRSQMKALRVDERKELSQILTPEQMSQWKQMMGPRMHKPEGGATGEGAGNNAGSGNGGGG
jgi:Spy/CpxP family protein refolding chaperone